MIAQLLAIVTTLAISQANGDGQVKENTFIKVSNYRIVEPGGSGKKGGTMKTGIHRQIL